MQRVQVLAQGLFRLVEVLKLMQHLNCVPAHVLGQAELRVVWVQLKPLNLPSGVALLPTKLKNHQEILRDQSSRMQHLLSTRP